MFHRQPGQEMRGDSGNRESYMGPTVGIKRREWTVRAAPRGEDDRRALKVEVMKCLHK